MSSCISDSLESDSTPSRNGQVKPPEPKFDASIDLPKRDPDVGGFGFKGWVIPETGVIVAQHKDNPAFRMSVRYSDRPSLDPRQTDFERFHAFMDIVRAYEERTPNEVPATTPLPPIQPAVTGEISAVLSGFSRVEPVGSGSMDR